jgi:hypothetical protein
MEDGYAQVLPANYPPRFLSFSTSDACWRTKAMPGLGTDLNLQPPESGQIYPIYWDGVAEFDGLAHELDYDMVCDDGIQGAPLLSFQFCQIFLLVMVSFFRFCFMP